MRNMLELNAEGEAGQPFGIVFGTRKRPDDVEQFFFGQTDERAAQQCPEGERVTAVGQNTRQRDQILDLLAAEQAFACLRGDRDAVTFERLLVSPKITDRKSKRLKSSHSCASRMPSSA